LSLPPFRTPFARLAVFAILDAALLLASGCASWPLGPRREVHAPTTGQVLTHTEMQLRTGTRYFGDEAYAEVDSAWLAAFYDDFRRELHRLGVVHWDERFDCNRFVEFYVALAQARFFEATFHSHTRARALAIGPYWYLREDGQGSHAVVQAVTERGRLFIDPQTGREIQLTPIESTLAYFQFF
jgi:hypothetical protein